MGVLATDNFNRTDAATLGANWTKLSSFSDLRITSNQCLASVSSPDCVDARTAEGAINLDQYSQIQLANTNSDGGPTVRSNTTSTFYLLDIAPGAGTFTVYKCVDGSFTNLNSVGSLTINTNDTCYIEVQGITVKTKQNGVVRNNFTDSAIDGSTVGGPYPGLHISNNVLIFDNYEMGDFAVAGSLFKRRIFIID